jgi:SAM-dependent methyltransferase
MRVQSSRSGRRALAYLKAAVRRLPAPRDEAAVDVLRGMRTLATGHAPNATVTERQEKSGANRKAHGLVAGPPIPKPPPLPVDTVRAEFPETSPWSEVRSLYVAGKDPLRFDLDLFEQLNKEYADHPLVPAPRVLEPAGRAETARKRVDWTQRFMDVRDTTVLEVGCGQGYGAYVLAHDYGSVVTAVDVVEYTTWAQLAGENVTFVFADMAANNPFEHDTFDRIVSYTVWEHVVHPRRLLQETYNVLKPGGQALIRANLYAGPMASHRYREIYFPWPHLLFSDDVISDWYVKNGHRPRRASWVNRLSWGHYERYIAEIGFNLRHLSFESRPFDEDFYHRFEDTLSRFPVEDLKRDFFNVVLEKPA